MEAQEYNLLQSKLRYMGKTVSAWFRDQAHRFISQIDSDE